MDGLITQWSGFDEMSLGLIEWKGYVVGGGKDLYA